MNNPIYNKHVHVINTHGLGDIVMIFPLINILMKEHPKTITFSVKSKGESDIIRAFFPSITMDKFVLVSKYKKIRNPALRFVNYVQSVRKLKPDIVITCFNVHPMLANLTAFFSNAKIRIGWESLWDFLNTTTVSVLPGKHKVFQNLSLLEALCRKKFYPQPPTFYIHSKKMKSMIKTIKDHGGNIYKDYIIGIAPGSGFLEKHKRWPVSKYAELIDRVKINTNFKVILLGSEVETDLSLDIIGMLKNKKSVINLTGKTTICESIHLLRLCNVVISNCNGLSHLAGAVGTKVIGLYGPTDPRHTGVFSSDSTIIKKEKNCSPCYGRKNITGCGNPTCMTDISVSEVFDTLMTIKLESYSSHRHFLNNNQV